MAHRADNKLIGKNYTPPDHIAKVTGKAKWAEDFRADGMLFCKLLLSPMPHARVRKIDLRAALAMPGVKAILTADDLPKLEGAGAERALTNEPLYQGEPVLAVAAVDELTAAEAIERIDIDWEPLPAFPKKMRQTWATLAASKYKTRSSKHKTLYTTPQQPENPAKWPPDPYDKPFVSLIRAPGDRQKVEDERASQKKE